MPISSGRAPQPAVRTSWPVFFYGLFMDRELLAARGCTPGAPVQASVAGFALRIGQRATLVPDPASTVLGLVMAVPPHELDQLYADDDVRDYRPMPVQATLASGETMAALAYVLPVPPRAGEANPQYAAKLRALCARLAFPAAYVDVIR